MTTGDRSFARDAFAEDLQQLRISAGNVSYALIAERVAAARAARGMSASASRVARSTVYDVFQPGRRRIDPDLVADIVIALGQDAEGAERWRARSLERHLVAPAAPSPAPEPAPSPAPVPAPAPSDPLLPRLRTALIITIMAAAVFMNLFGSAVASKLQLPLFLDMAGTALAAFVFGPWHGVAVAIATNALNTVISSPETIAFALVNVAGALVWGYGMRRLGRSWARMSLLTIAVALACTLVSAPLNILMYGGMGHASNTFVLAVEAVAGIVPAVFSVGFLVSIVDKVVVTVLAVALAHWIARLHLEPDAPWHAASAPRP
ncbi:ECF transporter S component [Microbacterium sp. LX3-4]|uniref:ECF transporter S component n=2 Tax=Microbacterium dauci TaxID=3048008 RepID=A0ABT6ZEU2_9MICO|nr:ECF transporter S component [Microbacterium sp. LX3-4]